MGSLIGRLRRGGDPETPVEDAPARHQDATSPSPVATPGPMPTTPQNVRTPLGSDGVPYRRDDPRFPDVWGRRTGRSPMARPIS
jgi:hypothetical protein